MIPRLELVSAHMASNLVANVKDALQDQFMDGWIAQWPYIGLKAEGLSTSSLLLTE